MNLNVRETIILKQFNKELHQIQENNKQQEMIKEKNGEIAD